VTDALQKVTRSAEEVLWGKRAVQALEEREIELQGGTVSADATPRGQLSVLRFRCYEAYARGLLKHGDLDAAEGVINTMLKYRLKPAPVARLRAKLYARRGDYPKALEVLDALPEPSTKEKVLRARLLREQGKQ
jgi:pentatricopeptide repeat protein